MLDALTFRGPDDRGVTLLRQGAVALGHQRLSIIDPSPAGRQPMANEDRSLWLVVNGEIYNFRDLREDLTGRGHRFRSDSDSEVILHAYEEWGDACVERLRGIFGLALWDDRRGRLLLARDHLGVKPVYYWSAPGVFVFASQPRSILRHPGFSATVDRPALSEYLAYGYVPRDRCIFRGIKKLPAAHRLTLEGGEPTIERYWSVEYRPEIADFDEAAERVRDKLHEAVRLQLASDVPVGGFLSGGIDSSSVIALAERSGSPLSTFTIGFRESAKDERSQAEEFVRYLGRTSDHHSRVLGPETAKDLMAVFADIYDEPFFDSSGLPTFLVSELARSHGVKVALAGDGGDELFCGYSVYRTYWALRHPWHPRAARTILEILLRRTRPARRVVPFRDPARMLFDLRGFLGERDQVLCLGDPEPVESGFADARAFREHFNPQAPAVTAAQLVDLHTYLDEILTKVDRASMAAGVETRVPFLDPELVELAFRIDARCIYRGRQPKAVLRSAMGDLLPPALLARRKRGFSIPLIPWMREDYGRLAGRWLDRGILVEAGVLDPAGVRELRSRRNIHWIWLLFAAELWARRWLAGQDRETIRSALD